MTHILFDCPNMDRFYEELKDCIPPRSRVAVIAFSFYDDCVKDAASWNRVYRPGGKDYKETIEVFRPFGIEEEDVVFVNYFLDTKESAAEKIRSADVIYFTGGLPDRMLDRIREFDLEDLLLAHRGVVAGYSAGAVIQLDRYHLSPDGDYPQFGYYEGLGYLSGFDLEVHYEHRPEQDASIAHVLREDKVPLYVLHTAKGGLVVKDGVIRTVGQVDVYPAST